METGLKIIHMLEKLEKKFQSKKKNLIQEKDLNFLKIMILKDQKIELMLDKKKILLMMEAVDVDIIKEK